MATQELSCLNYDGAHLFNKFKETAETIGATVCKVKGQTEAARKVAEVIKELAAIKVILAPEKLETKLGLNQYVTNANLYTSNLLQNGLDAEVGICEAQFAVVETGSLGIDCSDINVRLVTAIPPVHIALVPAETIIEKFVDSFKAVVKADKGETGYFSYISGPSRTADIERVLTIGVHGPEKLFIIVVE